jgi:hypothetical protein
MFIYNVTVNIDEASEKEWLRWMKEIHVPDVLKTGCFVDNQILKVFGVEEMGPTYSVQYRFREIPDIERYQKNFAPQLQKEHNEKFAEKFTAFRTLLQIVS